jgi:multidrug resistance efflux pump
MEMTKSKSVIETHSINGNGRHKIEAVRLPPLPPQSRRKPWARLVRLTLGLAFLILIAWVIAPACWYITSTQAVVNAPVVALHAPVDGRVTPEAIIIGQAVQAGEPLLRIDNDLIDRGPLEKLRTEEAALSERITALRKHLASLGQLKAKLTSSTSAYQVASLQRIEHELAAARQEAASAEALAKLQHYEVDLNARLGIKMASEQETVRARQNALAATAKVTETKEIVAKLETELAAAHKGVFVSTGDGRADVPYSTQRIHEVLLKEIDLESTIQELVVRRSQVASQLRTEEQYVKRRMRQIVRAPVDGIVWRRYAHDGTWVSSQKPLLLQLIKPKELFIDALVSEKYAGYIEPGASVRIKFIGSDAETSGVVQHVLGRSMAWDDKLLAADVPVADKGQIHVIVTFAEIPSMAGLKDCHVGHPVEVVFGNQGDFWSQLVARILP